MKEWIEVVQRMIDWIEEHVEQNKMLTSLSDEIGYSPWYCSVLFHDVTGMTIKSYASGRRLARAADRDSAYGRLEQGGRAPHILLWSGSAA